MYCYGIDFDKEREIEELFSDYVKKNRQQKLKEEIKEDFGEEFFMEDVE